MAVLMGEVDLASFDVVDEAHLLGVDDGDVGAQFQGDTKVGSHRK